MELSIVIIYVSLGIYMMINSYDKWRFISRSASINDDLVRRRKHYRNIAVWGLLFVIGAFRYYIHGILWDIRFLPETTCMLIIGIAFGYFHCFIEPYYNSSIVDKLTDFCLYLRPFELDKEIVSSSATYVNGFLGFKVNAENCVCSEFSKKVAQTFAIGNPNSNIPTTLFTSNIYANDDEWKNVIYNLSLKSKVIILHIGMSDGCLWEMRQCVVNNYLKKTIFIVDNNKMFNLVKEKCSIDIELGDNTISSLRLLYIDQLSNRWIAKSIKTKSDITQVVGQFVSSHNLLREEDISHYKGKRNPSKWWQILAFSTNAFAYCIYNRWPWRMWKRLLLTLSFYFLTAIMFGSIFSDTFSSLISSLAIAAVFLLPWFWKAPKISYQFQNAGGDCIHAENNRSLALWLCAFFLCNLIIFISPWVYATIIRYFFC